MTVRGRSVVIALLSVCTVACLAFVGVNFAPKPVSWMPGALGTQFVAVVLGLCWALHPAFASPRSMRLPLYMLSVLGLAVVFASASYYLFFAFWFAFGGQL